jgi:hypothetical protein
MVEGNDVRVDLLERVGSRRHSLQAYLRDNQPRFRRRTNITIVLSTVAAISTAGPALGGQSFAEGVQKALGLSSDAIVWRVLCLLALLVSFAAALLTNLGRSQDQAARLATAEAVEGELEGLSVLLQFGQLPVQDAVKLYQQYTAKVSYVPDDPTPAGSRPVAVAAPAPAAPPHRTGGLPAVPPPVRPRSTTPPSGRPRRDRPAPR